MTTYGVTETGFVKPTFAEVLEILQNKVKAKPSFGAKVNLTEATPLGQLVSVHADMYAGEEGLWNVLEAIYNALWRHSSEGVSLDNVGALIGIFRLAATETTVAARMVGTPGKTISPPLIVRTDDTADEYELDAAVTLDVGGVATGNFTAVEAGRNLCLAGHLTEIVTPITDLTSVINLVDGTPGRNQETDTEYRARQILAIQATGGSTVGAIQAVMVQDVDGVIDCLVVENDADEADADGRPATSFETMVYGGTAQDILDKIWDQKPAGILAFGNTDGTITDSEGHSQALQFSRPVEYNIWLHIKIIPSANFTQGAKQKVLITVDSTDDVDYELTINEFEFSFTALGNTKAEIAAGLIADIESGKTLADRWTPTTCTDNLDGSFYVECDYKGVPLVFSIDEDLMTIETETARSGDQLGIIERIVEYAVDLQTINEDVQQFLYLTPVAFRDLDNGVKEFISEAEVYLSLNPVPIDTDNISIPQTGETCGKAIILSTRITVEIVASI